jgi:hypothetical protein
MTNYTREHPLHENQLLKNINLAVHLDNSQSSLLWEGCRYTCLQLARGTGERNLQTMHCWFPGSHETTRSVVHSSWLHHVCQTRSHQHMRWALLCSSCKTSPPVAPSIIAKLSSHKLRPTSNFKFRSMNRIEKWPTNKDIYRFYFQQQIREQKKKKNKDIPNPNNKKQREDWGMVWTVATVICMFSGLQQQHIWLWPSTVISPLITLVSGSRWRLISYINQCNGWVSIT